MSDLRVCEIGEEEGGDNRNESITSSTRNNDDSSADNPSSRPVQFNILYIIHSWFFFRFSSVVGMYTASL